jgi:hypothetical protein
MGKSRQPSQAAGMYPTIKFLCRFGQCLLVAQVVFIRIETG